MRVLVLGGTGFVGRTIVERLLADGHEPALFNRGRNSSLFPGVQQLVGDRYAGDFGALKDGSWDAVVDVTSYLPRDVAWAMDALGDRVGRYLLVSSHAVIDGAGPGLKPAIRDASWPLTNDTYGPSKVACEQDVTARFGPRATIVRPCKVAGPYDDQDGLVYWVRAAAVGGRVELPGDRDQPIQLVDSRDLARLVVNLLTADRGGAFMAAGADAVTATERAYAALFGMVQRQAAMVSFVSLFELLGIMFIALVPLVLLMKRPRTGSAASAGH